MIAATLEQKEIPMPKFEDVAVGRARFMPFTFSAVGFAKQRRPTLVKRATRRFPGLKFTPAELREIRAAYGPFLSLERAAEIAGLAPVTLKKHISEGRYATCVKRKKAIRFVTERFVQELFGGSSQ